jgi:hypothetical protein
MQTHEGFLSSVTLSDDNYGVLLIKVREFFENADPNLEVLASHFVSDRYSKRSYYFAVLRFGAKKAAHLKDAQP